MRTKSVKVDSGSMRTDKKAKTEFRIDRASRVDEPKKPVKKARKSKSGSTKKGKGSNPKTKIEAQTSLPSKQPGKDRTESNK